MIERMLTFDIASHARKSGGSISDIPHTRIAYIWDVNHATTCAECSQHLVNSNGDDCTLANRATNLLESQPHNLIQENIAG